MKLEAYRGAYIDLSGLSEPAMGQERKRIKARHRYLTLRLLYGRISFEVYGPRVTESLEDYRR